VLQQFLGGQFSVCIPLLYPAYLRR
jgi:hypothetical protein